jgi:hypothetical protein
VNRTRSSACPVQYEAEAEQHAQQDRPGGHATTVNRSAPDRYGPAIPGREAGTSFGPRQLGRRAAGAIKPPIVPHAMPFQRMSAALEMPVLTTRTSKCDQAIGSTEAAVLLCCVRISRDIRHGRRRSDVIDASSR